MKKTFAIIISMIMAISFVACSKKENINSGTENNSNNSGGSGSVNVSVDNESNDETETGFDDEKILKQLTTSTYTWKEDNTHYIALIIKNNSDYDCAVKANITFKDSEGKNIGADDTYNSYFEKNTETCLIVSNDTAFSSFDYNLEVEKNGYTECASSSLNCEVSTTSKKAILSFKNNSESTISGSYYVLFMLGDKVVDHGWGYIDEVKPNSTKTVEAQFWNSKKSFDNVKAFYSGYIDED